MSIFSKVKKARKAANEHKKSAAQEQAAEAAKPPPTPYKHIPTHAAQDALAATPTTWSPEETRARIAEARKRRDATMTMSAPASAYHSRANSEINFPNRAVHRTRSDLSIDSVMHRSQSFQWNHSASDYPPPVPSLPSVHSSYTKLSEEHHTSSMSRDVPAPPALKQRPQYSGRPASRRNSSANRKRSPLSNESVEEEPEYAFSNGSESSNSSVASSSSDERLEMRPTTNKGQLKLPALPVPEFDSMKKQPSTTASALPYDGVSSASSTMPTWRHEDFITEAEPPVLVETISRTHSRASSLSRSIYQHNGSVSVAAY